jgi:predicted nucleic acid-binding Zn ribbon protein
MMRVDNTDKTTHRPCPICGSTEEEVYTSYSNNCNELVKVKREIRCKGCGKIKNYEL